MGIIPSLRDDHAPTSMAKCCEYSLSVLTSKIMNTVQSHHYILE